MRVRVDYTIDASDDYRRAINLRYNRPGLATREQVKRWLETHGTSQDSDLMQSLSDEWNSEAEDRVAELRAARDFGDEYRELRRRETREASRLRRAHAATTREP